MERVQLKVSRPRQRNITYIDFSIPLHCRRSPLNVNAFKIYVPVEHDSELLQAIIREFYNRGSGVYRLHSCRANALAIYHNAVVSWQDIHQRVTRTLDRLGIEHETTHIPEPFYKRILRRLRRSG